jgi:hypothetical protein
MDHSQDARSENVPHVQKKTPVIFPSGQRSNFTRNSDSFAEQKLHYFPRNSQQAKTMWCMKVAA